MIKHPTDLIGGLWVLPLRGLPEGIPRMMDGDASPERGFTFQHAITSETY